MQTSYWRWIALAYGLLWIIVNTISWFSQCFYLQQLYAFCSCVWCIAAYEIESGRVCVLDIDTWKCFILASYTADLLFNVLVALNIAKISTCVSNYCIWPFYYCTCTWYWSLTFKKLIKSLPSISAVRCHSICN